MSKSIKIILVFLLLVSLSRQATGYAAQFADEGETVRLQWKTSIVPIAFSTSLLKQNLYIKPGSDVPNAIQKSLETWETASNIKFQVSWTDKQTISPSGKSGDGINLVTVAQTAENVLLFGNDADEVSARTRIFFNRKGSITEADIVLNPYEQFSTDGSIGTFDLQATLTHEIGHLLGLEHSPVIGATMHEHQGKNGVYNLPGYTPRTLAEDDLTGIRALYGAKNSDSECCGTINGKLTLAGGKAAKSFQVWAENAESGGIIAGVLSNGDGDFKIEGLQNGLYNLYAQDYNQNQEKHSSFENLGEVEVVKDKSQTISQKLKDNTRNYDARYVGFNGQISELAVPLNGGKSYIIYVGGKKLVADNLTVGFNSPYLTVTPKSLMNHDYGSDISVISFEVNVDGEIPFGEYGFYLKSKDLQTQFSIGSLTVEAVVNEWNSHFLASEK